MAQASVPRPVPASRACRSRSWTWTPPYWRNLPPPPAGRTAGRSTHGHRGALDGLPPAPPTCSAPEPRAAGRPKGQAADAPVTHNPAGDGKSSRRRQGKHAAPRSVRAEGCRRPTGVSVYPPYRLGRARPRAVGIPVTKPPLGGSGGLRRFVQPLLSLSWPRGPRSAGRCRSDCTRRRSGSARRPWPDQQGRGRAPPTPHWQPAHPAAQGRR
jgi:hypothetical protein